jgi:hypothetical protein
MPTVEMHAPFTHYRGTIGKLVYRKVKGKTVVAIKPDADRPVSPAEAAQRKTFTEATAWATSALKNEEFRQTYEEQGRERDIPTRAAAVSDFLVPPTIEAPDLSGYAGQTGNKIYFAASDNVGVIGNRVTITDELGSPFESGIAVEIDPDAGLWMYTAMTAVPAGTTARVNIMVHDRPGNIAEVTEDIDL